jgi:hypothetical protein
MSFFVTKANSSKNKNTTKKTKKGTTAWQLLPKEESS